MAALCLLAQRQRQQLLASRQSTHQRASSAAAAAGPVEAGDSGVDTTPLVSEEPSRAQQEAGDEDEDLDIEVEKGAKDAATIWNLVKLSRPDTWLLVSEHLVRDVSVPSRPRLACLLPAAASVRGGHHGCFCHGPHPLLHRPDHQLCLDRPVREQLSENDPQAGARGGCLRHLHRQAAAEHLHSRAG